MDRMFLSKVKNVQYAKILGMGWKFTRDPCQLTKLTSSSESCSNISNDTGMLMKYKEMRGETVCDGYNKYTVHTSNSGS